MSSSESDDFDGFESAEEDVVVSDMDEDELERILAEDSSSEIKDTIESSDLPQEKPVLKKKSLENNSRVQTPLDRSNNSVQGPSNEIVNVLKSNESDAKQINNVLEADEPSSQVLQPCHPNNSKLESDKTKDVVLDSRPIIEAVGTLSVSSNEASKTDRNASNVNSCNGWDLEDDNVDLIVSGEDKTTHSITCGSSDKTNSLDSPAINAGQVSFGATDGDVSTSPNGWDLEDDFELSDEPEKTTHGLNKDQSSGWQPQTNDSNTAWSSWGNWGVTNLISSAAEGVTTTSWNHVTSSLTGLTSMLENTLGAPDPQTLAAQLTTDGQPDKPDGSNNELVSPELTDIFGIGSLLGGVKNLGNKVLDGGLGTLETLGKKTMEVLQEGDPGLKKKRALLFQTEKIILSQVLRDAKEKAEASEEEHTKLSRKAQYETLFDDFHGLVHLEALEMISRQCEIKLQSVPSNNHMVSPKEFNANITKVKSLFEQNCENEDKEKELVNETLKTVLDNCLEDLSLNVNSKTFLEVDELIQSRLLETFTDGTEIHTHAISDLARFTACAIELFHRIAELFIVKDHSDIEKDFKALSRIATVSKSKIGVISESYSGKLMLLPDKTNNPLITNIFLEASNSSSYLDNAFELFAPIIQLKAS